MAFFIMKDAIFIIDMCCPKTSNVDNEKMVLQQN